MKDDEQRGKPDKEREPGDKEWVETPMRAKLREKWGAGKLAEIEASIVAGLEEDEKHAAEADAAKEGDK